MLSLVPSFDLVSPDLPDIVRRGTTKSGGSLLEPGHGPWAVPHGQWVQEPKTAGVPGTCSCPVSPAGVQHSCLAGLWKQLRTVLPPHRLKHSIMSVWRLLPQSAHTDCWLCQFFILQLVWPLEEINLAFILSFSFNKWTYTQKALVSVSATWHSTFLICYLSKREQQILKHKRNFKTKQNGQESSWIIKSNRSPPRRSLLVLGIHTGVRNREYTCCISSQFSFLKERNAKKKKKSPTFILCSKISHFNP